MQCIDCKLLKYKGIKKGFGGILSGSGSVKKFEFLCPLEGSCQDLARCCQHLNSGLNRTECVKAKHCRGLSTNIMFSVQYKTDTKQNMVFSVAFAEWAQKFKFLYTTGSWQDSTKAFLNPLDFNNLRSMQFTSDIIGNGLGISELLKKGTPPHTHTHTYL